MALVARLSYREISSICELFYKDPRVQHLPLIGSPVPPLTVIILYILFATKWGPNWMNARKPFNVKVFIQVHNVLLILLNTYVFIFGIWNSYLQKDFSLTCQPVEFHNTSGAKMRLLRVAYIYYVTKYLDLFDTLFFILRKKNSQVSFLHVYHHALMVFSGWFYITLIFGGHATMLGVINSFVHMVMYGYYLVSSMNLKSDLTPWKKRITQIQILQFCYLVVHFSMPNFFKWCTTQFRTVHTIALIQNVFMAVMFLDFYHKAYIKVGKNKNKNKIA